MASITLKNVPEDLRVNLKAEASRQGRSLNQEILQRLRASLPTVRSPEEKEENLRGLRQLRERLAGQGVWIDDEKLNRYKREGRH